MSKPLNGSVEHQCAFYKAVEEAEEHGLSMPMCCGYDGIDFVDTRENVSPSGSIDGMT